VSGYPRAVVAAVVVREMLALLLRFALRGPINSLFVDG